MTGTRTLFPGLCDDCWVAIVSSGRATGLELVGCVCRYVASKAPESRHFLVQFHAFLENGGWMAYADTERRGAPDPTPTVAPYRGPMSPGSWRRMCAPFLITRMPRLLGEGTLDSLMNSRRPGLRQ